MIQTPQTTWTWRQRLSLMGSVLLLCGAGLESRHFRAPPDATQYRLQVGAARALLPMNFGDWQGKDQPPDASAVKLLRPYFIISRDYTNSLSGKHVGFLFVDCQDARDTVGHYPPICYPAQGWSKEGQERRNWALPAMTVHGTEYTFVKGSLDTTDTIVVDDFFVIPGNETAPDRDAVIAAARDLQRRFYGVAQVQLVFPGETTQQERQQAFSDLIGPLDHLIRTVETVQPQPPAGAGDSGTGGVQ